MGKKPGYLPGDKKDKNKKIGGKEAVGALQSEMDKMKVLTRHELKHDVEFLNQAQQLRHAVNDGDKKAKKFLKLKMKHETAYE